MKFEVRYLTRTALLLALTMGIQLMSLPQPVTGPVVNLILYLSVLLVGMSSGLVIGAVTPWIALTVGILPPPLAPMIPFIIAGNMSLVIVFGLLRKFNVYVGIIAASVLKFLILASGVRFFIQVPPVVAKAMQIPQLITALVGGILAVILFRVLDKFSNEDSNSGKKLLNF
ncbi:MAG: ECF transporter S component [Halanaerobiales bacterium]|nr:ECF transporter S component [Halanaerobiales bacterium]